MRQQGNATRSFGSAAAMSAAQCRSMPHARRSSSSPLMVAYKYIQPEVQCRLEGPDAGTDAEAGMVPMRTGGELDSLMYTERR